MVFQADWQLLEDHGHQVTSYELDNQSVAQLGRLKTAFKTVWSQKTYRDIRVILQRDRYDRVIVHNFFPLVSPSIYYTARKEKVPLIQYLHNFRLFCLNGLFFRDGRVCEDCFRKQIPWPGVIHSCYKGSFSGSIVVAAMLCTHRLLKTWTTKVDRFIALSEFSRKKFIEGGLPADRIVVKPNFIGRDPGPGEGKGGYAVFIGRLTPEKGITHLLSAWKELGNKISLKIIGEGTQAKEVQQAIEDGVNIEWFGKIANEKVIEVLKDASCLIFPSGCYENFPRVILEAYSVGTPVIAYNLGSTGEIVIPGRTGYLVPAGDVKELADCVNQAFHEQSMLESMRKSTRQEYLDRYTAQQNYQRLMKIIEG